MATSPTALPRPSRSRATAHGGHYQDTYQPPAARLPVREDAPTRIFCFIEDLFFLAKIQETARKLGVKVEFVKGDKESRGPADRSAGEPSGPRCWSLT